MIILVQPIGEMTQKHWHGARGTGDEPFDYGLVWVTRQPPVLRRTGNINRRGVGETRPYKGVWPVASIPPTAHFPHSLHSGGCSSTSGQ